MVAQALYAWIYPSEAISQNFFSAVSNLYIFELVFMHSSIFWIGRSFLIKKNTNKLNKKNVGLSKKSIDILLALFLFIAYSLFIIPMYKQSPLLVWNYISLNILRLFQPNEISSAWYTHTQFYKKWLNEEMQPFILFTESILKIFYFALIIPFAAHLLPLPNLGLNADIAMTFPTDDNSPFGIIILTKAMFLYFFSLFILDIFNKIYKFLYKP